MSNKKSGITSKAKLEGVAKHNLRKYKLEEYSADNIKLLCGTENLVEDVKKIYHQEFDDVLKAYNEKQTRADRKICQMYCREALGNLRVIKVKLYLEKNSVKNPKGEIMI